MEQVKLYLSSNTPSSKVLHAVSQKDKKIVILRITNRQEQYTNDDLHKTINALKTMLVSSNTVIHCIDCGKHITQATDLEITPTGDKYCQTCY